MTFGTDQGIAARANVLVERDPIGAAGVFETVGCILNHTPPPISREVQEDEPCMNFDFFPDWQPATEYQVGDLVNNQGNRYRCTVAGTSGTTGPTHTAGNNVGDGTAWWLFLGAHEAGDEFGAGIPSPLPGEMENSEFNFTTVWEPGSETTHFFESAIKTGTNYNWEIHYSNGFVQMVTGWVRSTTPQQGNRGSGKWKTDVTVVAMGDWSYRAAQGGAAAEVAPVDDAA